MLGEAGERMKDSAGAAGDAGESISDTSAAPGLGDEAFFGPNQQLHVLIGDFYFAVSPPTMKSRMSGGNPLLSEETKRKMATAIAHRVFSKL
jgi:hypothetical protein